MTRYDISDLKALTFEFFKKVRDEEENVEMLGIAVDNITQFINFVEEKVENDGH